MQEPFGYFKAEPFGWTDCAETDEGAIALYAAPVVLTEQWQPIETAPEEMEVFIGALIDGVFKFGRSVLFYEQANEFAGETWSGWVWSIDDCNDSVAENPTHWMPLPPPPPTETEEAAP